MRSRSLTTRNSQFWPFDPVGALRASSMQRSTMASSTGSGFSRRMARWVTIASCSGMSRPFSTSLRTLPVETAASSETAAPSNPSDTFPPDLEAEVEEAAHVVDVGLEVRDGGHDLGSLRQLGALLLLTLGHDLEVEEALADLPQHGRHRVRLAGERFDGAGDLRRIRTEQLGDAGGVFIEEVGRQHLVEHKSAQVEVAVVEGVDEELGLPNRDVLERADDDERRAAVVQQAVYGARPFDEAVVHRLEEHEELGDVLQELRAQDAVGDLVEGPGGEVDDTRPRRCRQPAQEAAAEEVGHVLGRLEEVNGVPRRGRVDDDEVVVAARVDLVEALHGDVVVALHEASRQVLVERVLEDALRRRLVGSVEVDEGVPRLLGVEHGRPQLAARLHAGLLE